MNHQVRLLFHELADLTRPERERIFAERQVAPELRAEVESLLGFDAAKARSLTDCVSRAAERRWYPTEAANSAIADLTG
jgi:hypothetical protein